MSRGLRRELALLTGLASLVFLGRRHRTTATLLGTRRGRADDFSQHLFLPQPRGGHHRRIARARPRAGGGIPARGRPRGPARARFRRTRPGPRAAAGTRHRRGDHAELRHHAAHRTGPRARANPGRLRHGGHPREQRGRDHRRPVRDARPRRLRQRAGAAGAQHRQRRAARAAAVSRRTAAAASSTSAPSAAKFRCPTCPPIARPSSRWPGFPPRCMPSWARRA